MRSEILIAALLALPSACCFDYRLPSTPRSGTNDYRYYPPPPSSSTPPADPCASPQPTNDAVLADAALPPPISGGTIIALSDGHTVAASDPDRDVVWIVDTQTRAVSSLALKPHDEPGRLVQDGAGRVHVALRRGGGIVTFDPKAPEPSLFRPACADARGIAWQAETDELHVACATGELVTLPAAGGAVTRRELRGGDLRDVLMVGGRRYVTRFRSAEVFDTGSTEPPRRAPVRDTGIPRVSGVAWRTIATTDGALVMVHQLASLATIDLSCTGPRIPYYAPPAPSNPAALTSVVVPSLSVFRNGVARALPAVIPGSLPTDVAVSRDCRRLAVVSAGTGEVTEITAPEGSCAYDSGGALLLGGLPGAVSLTYLADGSVVVQQRLPAQLTIYPPSRGTPAEIALTGAKDIFNNGHALFHQDSSHGVACASCHPEGREDGLTWTFVDSGNVMKRRTQSLGGGLLATAPFHWKGDESSMQPLVMDVFAHRMGGPTPSVGTVRSMGEWLDALPAPAAAPATDPAAVERGRSLFESPQVGCGSCHSGPHLTNNASALVRGEVLQVPSLLGLSARAPYLHDGCAATLRDRFSPTCSSDTHGNTSSLKTGELDDLIAYLNTL